MYTPEEKAIIKTHIKAIENYCRNEIAPQIEGRYVYVDFSENRYRKDGTSFKHSYGFYVDKNGTVEFSSGALSIVIDEHYEQRSYSVNAYKEIQYTEALLLRWQTVKAKLLDEIRQQKQNKSAILNFTV